VRATDEIDQVEDIQAVSNQPWNMGGYQFRPNTGFLVWLADKHADLDCFSVSEVLVLDQVGARKDVEEVGVGNEEEKPEQLFSERQVELAAFHEAPGVDNEKVAGRGTGAESDEGEVHHKEADLER
jgi:hypothetical protein